MWCIVHVYILGGGEGEREGIREDMEKQTDTQMHRINLNKQ